MKLDENTNGLNYGDHTFMIAGYIKDYKQVAVDIVADIEPEKKKEKTYLDFKENKGYVDNEGYVWIFRKTPNEKEKLPWFTVELDENMVPQLKFNPRKALYDRSAFHISKVGDLSAKAIINDTTDKPVEYDEAVLESVARATAVINPDIEPNDDFLKKMVKQTILSKGVNVNKYKVKVVRSWILTNLINALLGKTKTGPKAFLQWMELLDCDFELKIIDNGQDKEDPLREPLIYKSVTDKIQIGKEKEDNGDKNNKMARSVKM